MVFQRWFINWVNNVCLFEIRYEFCNIWNNILGSEFFSMFKQLWFILLGHMVYFPSCLLYSAATWSVCRVESALFIPDVQKKTQTTQTQTHKRSLRSLVVQDLHVCYFKASVIPCSYIQFQQLFGNCEFSYKERLLSMPVSSYLLNHVNYELFGVPSITFKFIILQHL